MTAITDLPGYVFRDNILPRLNLQQGARLRATCKRFHDDPEITKFLTYQLNAANCIRAVDLKSLTIAGKKKPLTKRQIKLIQQDWIRLANEPCILLPVEFERLISPITSFPCQKLSIAVRENASLQEIFKALREYLEVPQDIDLQFVMRGECNKRLNFFKERNLPIENPYPATVDSIQVLDVTTADIKTQFYKAFISEKCERYRNDPLNLDKISNVAKLRTNYSANAVFLGITLALFAIAFLKYFLFSNFAD